MSSWWSRSGFRQMSVFYKSEMRTISKIMAISLFIADAINFDIIAGRTISYRDWVVCRAAGDLFKSGKISHYLSLHFDKKKYNIEHWRAWLSAILSFLYEAEAHFEMLISRYSLMTKVKDNYFSIDRMTMMPHCSKSELNDYNPLLY